MKMRKCMMIKPDKTITKIEFKDEFKQYQCLYLSGLDYLNEKHKLVMYCKYDTKDPNIVAMTIFKYMKLRFNTINDHDCFNIYGDVILHDELVGNIGKETWERIKLEIDCKKKRQAPQPDVNNYIKFAKEGIRGFEVEIENANTYGRNGYF